jgi:hypothetical protein
MAGGEMPPGATWLRFPRFVGCPAMRLPVLRLLIPTCNQRGLFQHRACSPHPTAQQVFSFQFSEKERDPLKGTWCQDPSGN